MYVEVWNIMAFNLDVPDPIKQEQSPDVVHAHRHMAFEHAHTHADARTHAQVRTHKSTQTRTRTHARKHAQTNAHAHTRPHADTHMTLMNT